jgi:hypothetical protein
VYSLEQSSSLTVNSPSVMTDLREVGTKSHREPIQSVVAHCLCCASPTRLGRNTDPAAGLEQNGEIGLATW